MMATLMKIYKRGNHFTITGIEGGSVTPYAQSIIVSPTKSISPAPRPIDVISGAGVEGKAGGQYQLIKSLWT